MKISSKIGFIISLPPHQNFWCGGLFLVAGMIFIFLSCNIPRKFPPEPEIKFENYTLKDSVIGTFSVKYVILKISFTDGDGDIGLDDSDALSPYTNCKDTTCNNLYINRYGVKGGVLQDPIPFNYRIPVITPTGQNKTLKETHKDLLGNEINLNENSEHYRQRNCPNNH